MYRFGWESEERLLRNLLGPLPRPERKGKKKSFSGTGLGESKVAGEKKGIREVLARRVKA